MANKGIGTGECPEHGEYYLDAEDSPCPGCEDTETDSPLRCQECNGTNVHVAVGPGFKPSPWCEDCKDFVTLTQDLEPNNYALCVHCGASHHMDEAHTCEGGA